MSNITVSPRILKGSVTVPPSKSDVHRAILCAALAKGKSVISPVDLSQDITATINCVKALGAYAELNGNTLTVDGSGLFSCGTAKLNCNESGSTLRFMIPIAAAGGVTAEFEGKGRLPQRPIGIYLDCLPKAGIKCDTRGGLPLVISGRLKSGEFKIPGDVSSQFITGLLLSLPLLDGDSKILLTSPAQSVGYINMTIRTMSKFGVKVTAAKNGYFIKGGQKYNPANYTCEGDWSQAAFFMAAGALGGEIEVNGVSVDSLQGDRQCAEIFKRFGADITQTVSSVKVKCGELKATDIDAEQIPDLVPILAVTAAFAKGTTHITGAARLRIKESDRLHAISDCLNRLGAKVTENPDGLTIKGVQNICGGKVDGYNDHRIVMSMAIAAEKSTGDIIISDKESINKSYPNFFNDYNALAQ